MSEELQKLYPFLHGQTKNKGATQNALLESIKQKVSQAVEEKQRFFKDNADALISVSQAIADVYKEKKHVFSMGNGGSSCDAAHFAVEFQHPVTTGRPALPAINLASDTAFMTAVANDVNFDQVFARQIESLGTKGDGLIGFSTSGNSKNLLEAFRRASNMGITTIALTGGDGGMLAQSKFVDHCLIVKTDSIHRVQEIHVTCYHIIWDLVHTLLADYRGMDRP